MTVKNLSKFQTLALALVIGLLTSCLLFGAIYLMETANSGLQIASPKLFRMQLVCAVAGVISAISAWLVFKDEQTKYSFYY